MFKFVHAWQPGDSWEPLAAAGFVGIERAEGPSDDAPPAGVAVVGWSSPIVLAAMTKDVDTAGARQGVSIYVLVAGLHRQPAQVGDDLRALLNDAPSDCELHLLNAGQSDGWTGAWNARKLWDVLEAIRHPRVKLALDLRMAAAVGDSAAVVVPMLNLRIGQIRVGQIGSELGDYARRLAGIGFDGYVVTDPPAGPDRAAASIAIATAFRDVLPPVKAVKKVPAKAAK